MGKLLFDSQPLVIDRTLAKIIGLNESIVLQQIHYWLEINKKKRINFYKEKYWTYNSCTEWQESDFIFWSVRTIERIIKTLEDLGLLITDNFNADRRDRTKWYSIDYDKLDLIEQEYYEKQTDKLTECIYTIWGAPLPEISPETSSENTNQSDQMEFDLIDDMLQHYADKLNLPVDNVTKIYDRCLEQYKAGNVLKFTPYFETALKQEKIDFERTKFSDG